VKSFIERAMENHLECTITTDIIIAYTHQCQVACAIGIDGSIHPNGYMACDVTKNEKFEWRGDLHSNNRSNTYLVGLAAKVFKKIAYTRASGSKVEYQRPDYPNLQFESPGERLNGFVGINFDPALCEHIPYSDAAASFFYDAMIAMCKLADRVESFIGDKAALQIAIENRAGLLPAPQTTKGGQDK
jgi:hypothetical protein